MFKGEGLRCKLILNYVNIEFIIERYFEEVFYGISVIENIF